MKTFLEKAYIALIAIMSTLYIMIIRLGATDNNLIYSVGLVILGVFIGVVPFLLNKSKKKELRIMFLVAMTSLSTLCVYKGIYYLVLNSDINDSWIVIIQSIILAVAITSLIFSVVLLVKDFLKKDYPINKTDFDNIKSVLSLLYYFFATYFVLVYAGQVGLNLDQVSKTFKNLVFYGNEMVVKGLVIGLVIYLTIYITISIICYNKFEKTTINQTRDFK